jgi:tetratricopeptide (TPR) repeat protein
LAYVLYSGGRIGDAIPVQRRALELAEALGDLAEAAAAEGNIAGLLHTAGDGPRSYEHAVVARRRYLDMEMASNSTLGCINLIVLGTAAACLGRFDEALETLIAAERMAGQQAAVGAQAKARIALAGVWLTLGRTERALSLVTDLPVAAIPGMQMQAALIRARAEILEGRSGRRHFEHLGQLMDMHPNQPLVQSAWIEWSYQGPAREVIDRLRPIRAQCEAAGLPGIARSLKLREIDRAVEHDEPESVLDAARLGQELLPWIDEGLSYRTYPPEGWLVLSRVFARAGKEDLRAHCLRRARAWVQDRADHVPAAHRESFLTRNPVNRALIAATL